MLFQPLQEMAQAELHRFEQGVMEERNQRDKEVQEKKILVEQRVECLYGKRVSCGQP